MSENKRIDEDWKAQAEAEKLRIEASMAPSLVGEGEHAKNPRVSITVLVEQLGAQAMAGLGQMADPRTGRPHVDLDLARDAIDMIGLVAEKTRGNLEAEEARTVGEILNSLRMAYQQVSQAYGAAQQGAAQQGQPEPEPEPGD